MTAWSTHRHFALLAVALLLGAGRAAALPLPPQLPPSETLNETTAEVAPLAALTEKFTTRELRRQAEAAERAGDWETAFGAYCRLYVADRSAPDVREKLNGTFRRVQQVRRHGDPAYAHFLATLTPTDAAGLFAEIALKIPVMYADPVRATPQTLWAHGVEELDRALSQPAFRMLVLENAAPEKVEAFRKSLRSTWAKRSVANPKAAREAVKALLGAAQDAMPVRLPAALAVELVYGACSGLDEYTVFLNPASLTPDGSDFAADLIGYGIYLGFQDGGLIVEGVAARSWAAFNTPLRKGDRIARINGRSMNGPAAVAEALRTPLPDGAHEIDLFPMTPEVVMPPVRLPLSVPTVFGASLLNSKDGIGYLRIAGFQPTTARELDEAVAQLKAAGMRSLVIDLRGNHGGSFLAGVEVARRLLPAGLIVTTQGQLPVVDNQAYSSQSGLAAIDVPLVVLIDTETASAAEVVAAALKDNHRATLIGTPTFGKGTIQYPLSLSSADDTDGTGRPRLKSGTVRVTIARLMAPNGSPLNGAGVLPDITVPDTSRDTDAALRRAVELFQRSPMPPMQQ